MHYALLVHEHIDWTLRGAYMHARHAITVEVANDAISDPQRVVIDPDYNSSSGHSIRIIGYSRLVNALVTVIVLEDEGKVYGVNGWVANAKDRQIYGKEGDDGQD